MAFIPSAYSDASLDVTQDSAATGPTVSVSTDLSADKTKQALDVGLTVAKSLFGIGDDDRAEPDVIRAKIENKQRMYDELPSFLKSTVGQIYLNDINKLKAELATAEQVAAETDRSAKLYELGKIGIVVGIFAGVIILGGVALNQVQKARITQAQLRQLESK